MCKERLLIDKLRYAASMQSGTPEDGWLVALLLAAATQVETMLDSTEQLEAYVRELRDVSGL